MLLRQGQVSTAHKEREERDSFEEATLQCIIPLLDLPRAIAGQGAANSQQAHDVLQEAANDAVPSFTRLMSEAPIEVVGIEERVVETEVDARIFLVSEQPGFEVAEVLNHGRGSPLLAQKLLLEVSGKASRDLQHHIVRAVRDDKAEALCHIECNTEAMKLLRRTVREPVRRMGPGESCSIQRTPTEPKCSGSIRFR